MPIKRPPLINNEIYHIITRGVGDVAIFRNKDDYYRAIFSLYEFNTSVTPITIRERRKARIKSKKANREQFSDDRDLIVEILAFCFMPNHIHLLLRQIKKDGISQFMRKFGAGYATFFNNKYDRKGHLFQGRFRAIHIKTNDQFKNIFVYIHTNGISLLEPKWKENGIKNPEKVIEFLGNYKWSSYPDYIGKNNFPSLTKRDFFLKIMGGTKGYRKIVEDWIKYKGEIENLDDVVLE